jgi:hypothetical protein
LPATGKSTIADQLARLVGAPYLRVHRIEQAIVDSEEHRRRVLTRGTDVDGLVKPTWEDVVGREYDPWSRPHLVIDSVDTPPDQAAQRVAANIVAVRQERSSP